MKLLRPSMVLCSAAFLALFAFSHTAPAQATAGSDTVLTAQAAGKLLPDAVFYAGKSANTQLRNATGVHFGDGAYTLAVLVDTSGYSTAVQEKYQGYLLIETTLQFAGHSLPAGAYGFGFVKGQFLVMDIGNHDVFQTPTAHDANMHLPRPLQVLPGSSGGEYRLCSGKDCVTFSRAH